jgi:hypothetical protein
LKNSEPNSPTFYNHTDFKTDRRLHPKCADELYFISNRIIEISTRIGKYLKLMHDKKPYKTVKHPTGRGMLKLTNYKPKLNERAVGVGVEPTRSSYFTLLLFPKPSPPRQGGVSANFTTLQYILFFQFLLPSLP